MRRSSLLASLVAGSLLAVPAVAAADCVKTTRYAGSLRAAEWDYAGNSAKVGEAVSGKSLTVGEVYYVPKGKSARVKMYGYTHRVAAGTAFLVQCDIWTGKDIYFRLLDGKVKVSGRAVKAGAEGSPRGSYVVTPDATLLPLPGKAKYTVTRVASRKKAKTRTAVQAARGAGNLFVKIHSHLSAGKKIPCQAGGRITVFGNGKYRNG